LALTLAFVLALLFWLGWSWCLFVVRLNFVVLSPIVIHFCRFPQSTDVTNGVMANIQKALRYMIMMHSIRKYVQASYWWSWHYAALAQKAESQQALLAYDAIIDHS
jgi:hypothetical protein